MRVLYITNVPSPYRVEFFNELSQYCDLTVAYEKRKASDRNNEWKNKNNRLYREIFLNGISIKEDSAICPGIFGLLMRKWDIIVISGYATPTGIMANLFLKAISRKFWISADGGMISKDNGFKHKIKKLLISDANWWLSTGKITTAYLEYYGAQRNKIYEYPFASFRESDISSADPDKVEIKRNLNIKEKFVVVSIGQFIERKGFDVLLRACALLGEDIGVYIIGGKPTEQYKKIVNKLQLRNVTFLDFKSQEELKKYYKSADLFVLPTREDIWGLVVNEAMAFGLPVITTDKCVAGLTMIKEERNGWIVPVDDYIAIADKINEAFSNQVNLEEMRGESIKTAEEYTIEKMALRHIELFKDLHSGI